MTVKVSLYGESEELFEEIREEVESSRHTSVSNAELVRILMWVYREEINDPSSIY